MLADAAPPSLVRKQAAKLLHTICVQLVKSGHIDVPFAKGDDECEVLDSFPKSYITRLPLVPLQPPPLQLLGAPRLGFAQ